MSILRPLENLQRVYCAGPLFNAAERHEMSQIASLLQQDGFETFLPHADGMEFARVRPYLIEQGCDADEIGQILHSAIFALDTYQVIVGCGALVLNMNGRVPDEGGVAELSMAWMLGKPVVIFKEDARSAICHRDNPLIVGQTNFEIVTDMTLLGPALSERIGLLTLGSDWQTPCPPHLEDTLRRGARLWSQLQSLGDCRDSAPVAELVLDLFGTQRQSAA